MEAKTLQALKESIAHWERMRDGTQAEREGPYTQDCALCDLFILDDCEGCPIFESTGQTVCKGTPYGEAFIQFRERNPTFPKTAQKMIDFLKSLLPTTEQENSNDHP